MGEVYEAIHERLGRHVAVKVLSSEGADEETRIRFMREGMAASRIRHPNVVSVTDAGEHEGTYYLVMELLDGEPLSDLLERSHRLPLTQAVDLCLPLAAALATAHRQGVIHRDLKPANVFLADVGRGEPEPKLLDFGISKMRLGPEDPALTQNPRFLGTPLYIAPEQAEGCDATEASDQYGLALTLYETVLGHRPHEQHRTSLVRLLRAVADADIEPPSSLDPALPSEFDQTLRRALSRIPSDRFPSIRAFGEALLPFASASRRDLWRSAFEDVSEDTLTSVSGAVLGRGAAGGVTLDGSAPTPRLTRGEFVGHESLFGNPRGADKAFQGVDFVPEMGSAIIQRPESPVSQTPLPVARDPERTGSVSQSSSVASGHVGSEPARSHTTKRSSLGWRWLVGVTLALGAVGTAYGLGASQRQITTPERSEPTYRVVLRTEPPSAQVELDGTHVGAGRLEREFVRDGSAHHVRVSADGFTPQTMSFRDAPPPERVVLTPIETPRPPRAQAPSESSGAQSTETPTVPPTSAALAGANAITSPPSQRKPGAKSAPPTPLDTETKPGAAVTSSVASSEPPQPNNSPKKGPSSAPEGLPMVSGNLDPWAR